MSVLTKNNVVVKGRGETAIVFAHGFGCDQNMWRYIVPTFEDNYKVVQFDHVGAGNSDLSAYSFEKYNKLEGYAEDIIDIAMELDLRDVIFVGHSVSSVIGMLASIMSPGLFKKLVLVSPSPCYINHEAYIGGFEKFEIEELLESLDKNHMGWSTAMAPVIMGNPERKELGTELTESFCKTNPEIAKHFARTTFLTDKRDILNQIDTPSLILQCSDDIIAPVEVGQYMHAHMKNSTLVVMKATGHCPNLSAPEETLSAILEFLQHE